MFGLTRGIRQVGRLTSLLRPQFAFSQNHNNSWKVEETLTPEEIKTRQIIAKNIGMNKFLTRTYNTTGISIIGALSASYLGTALPVFAANPGAMMIGGVVAMFGGFLGANWMKPRNVIDYENGAPILRTENSPLRLALYGLGTFGLGLTASPLFAMAHAISPSILPTALGITSAIFGGASMAAYNMPKDKMLGYGRLFSGALLGLIGLQLIGLGALFFTGPNIVSTMLFRADTYLGILLFSGFIAYDTHVAIKFYESGNADHLGMSTQFLLDFWNILIRVVQILGKFRD